MLIPPLSDARHDEKVFAGCGPGGAKAESSLPPRHHKPSNNLVRSDADTPLNLRIPLAMRTTFSRQSAEARHDVLS